MFGDNAGAVDAEDAHLWGFWIAQREDDVERAWPALRQVDVAGSRIRWCLWVRVVIGEKGPVAVFDLHRNAEQFARANLTEGFGRVRDIDGWIVLDDPAIGPGQHAAGFV